MERPVNDIPILIFSSNDEEKSRYRKVIRSIIGIKNNMPYLSSLTYKECRQGCEKNLEECVDDADIILLLISMAFMGSVSYQEEVEIVLQRHRRDKVRVIPILLSPSAFEESKLLHGFQPLPSDGRPISTWLHVDAALVDVARGLRQIIRQILKDRGYVEEEQDEDSDESDNTSVSSTAFNWTDSIAPFNYLTFSGKEKEEGIPRLQRLRMIMRTFYEHQKVLFHDQLDEQAIYELVQQKSDGEYSLQDCQKDLKYLVFHSNLVRLDDMSSMVHSIAAFDALLYKKAYQATSDGFDIEHLIEDKMQSNKGRLSRSDLGDVKQHLLEINEYLGRSELRPKDQDEIADKWGSIFKTWEDIVKGSRDYFSAMERNAQYGQYDFDKYMQYKNTVTTYVQGFADALLKISHEINDLFSSWSQKKDLLIHTIAQSEYRKQPDLESGLSLEETVELIRNQVTNLETWFKEGAHTFYERAASEIHRVVNRATSLALFQRFNVNNLTSLSGLASQLMHITNFESALQIFDGAFAHALPLHLSENLAGHAQIYEQPEDMSSVWDEAPPAHLSFMPAKQRNAATNIRKPEDPMQEDLQGIYELQAGELQKELDRQQRFARLFAQGSLDLRALVSIDPLDRDILEDIIDACLNRPDGQSIDQTGKSILLINPREQSYIYLCSLDGNLFLPCYQLKLQNPLEKSHELLLIGDDYA